MTEILLGLILLFVALDWWEHSEFIRDTRRKLPAAKADIKRRYKNRRRRRA